MNLFPEDARIRLAAAEAQSKLHQWRIIEDHNGDFWVEHKAPAYEHYGASVGGLSSPNNWIKAFGPKSLEDCRKYKNAQGIKRVVE